MIRYQIFKTRLSNETKYVARIKVKETYDQQMLVDRMLEVGTSVSRGDVQSVLNLLQTTVEKLCGEGCMVALDGFVRFAPAIGGTFDSEASGFDGSRNSTYINASVSSTFNTRFNLNTGVEKVAATFRSPLLFSVDDLASDTNNTKVTKANIVSIAGERLKFDLQNPGEYLRFVNADDPTQFVSITRFQKLGDKEIVFLMPDTAIARGYFELANSMNTSKVRTEKSPVVEVAA
jgi:hypothetical protein